MEYYLAIRRNKTTDKSNNIAESHRHDSKRHEQKERDTEESILHFFFFKN